MSSANVQNQKGNLGTLGRVPEIDTNMYHLYVGHKTVV